MGYQFQNVGSAMVGLGNYCADIISKISDSKGAKASGAYA